jgi:hypothetical protein
MNEINKFFMDYGWTILASIIVVAVLAYFGVFGHHVADPFKEAKDKFKEAKDKFCIENKGTPIHDDMTKDCAIKEGNFTTKYIIKNISGELTFLK